jgi:dTDP-3,4-didehydro-2,6-dideoxy-alpha-D-glucose 3-reductase
MKKIRVGLLSVGKHCKANIIPALISMDAIEVVGFCTRNIETITNLIHTYGFTYFTNDAELLSIEDLDFVYISSPNSEHYSQVIMALDHGVNVVVEKTAIDSFNKTAEVITIADAKGLMIYEAFMYKHHSQFLRVKQIIDQKIYGVPKKVFINFGFPHLSSADIRYSKGLSGGALMDAGAYTISAVQELFPDNELVYSSLDNQGYEVDIAGSAVFLTKGGIKCFLNWGFGLSYKNDIEIWTDDSHVIVDRAFSKPADFRAEIMISKNGKISLDSDESCNHFIKMFDYVFGISKNDYRDINKKLFLQMKKIDSILKNGK